MGLYFKNQEVELTLNGDTYEVNVGSPLVALEEKNSSNATKENSEKTNDQNKN